MLGVDISNSMVNGDDGDDTLVFSYSVISSTIDGGNGNDSILFKGNINLGSNVNTNTGNDTILIEKSVVSASFSLGDGKDLIYFSSGIDSSFIDAGSDSDYIVFSATIKSSNLVAGDGDDTLVFSSSANISQSIELHMEAGNDSILFNNNTVIGNIYGGKGNDSFTGKIAIDNTGVSFWSGIGNDFYDLTAIDSKSSSATSYFWNEGGFDTIIFGSLLNSSPNSGSAAYFGVSSGASLDLRFIPSQPLTVGFGNSTFSSAFGVPSTLISFGIGSNKTTILFSTGEIISFSGSLDSTTSTITSAFSNSNVGNSGTANFGILMPKF